MAIQAWASTARRSVAGFEFSEDTILAAPPVMEGEHLAGSERLVGEDDLEVVAIGMGDEEIELHGVFVLLFDPSANEEETVANI